MDSDKLVKINVDNSNFFISRKTLKSYPNFYEQLNDQTNDRVLFSNNTYFIDADEDSFKLLISYIRGYNLSNDLDTNLLNKVSMDAKYFGLNNLINDNEPQSGGVRQSFKNSIDSLVNELSSNLDSVDRNEVINLNLSSISEIDKNEDYLDKILNCNKINSNKNLDLFMKGGNDSDFNIPKTKQEIKSFFSELQENINTNPIETMTSLSTDKNIINFIKNINLQQSGGNDSEPTSLGMNDLSESSENEKNNNNSELITDTEFMGNSNLSLNSEGISISSQSFGKGQIKTKYISI
jgi:hypothetical protein